MNSTAMKSVTVTSIELTSISTNDAGYASADRIHNTISIQYCAGARRTRSTTLDHHLPGCERGGELPDQQQHQEPAHLEHQRRPGPSGVPAEPDVDRHLHGRGPR